MLVWVRAPRKHLAHIGVRESVVKNMFLVVVEGWSVLYTCSVYSNGLLIPLYKTILKKITSLNTSNIIFFPYRVMDTFFMLFTQL